MRSDAPATQADQFPAELLEAYALLRAIGRRHLAPNGKNADERSPLRSSATSELRDAAARPE
jgi:hypothetical protein